MAGWGVGGRFLAFPWERTMTKIVFLVEEDPDGGFTARALGEPIFTEAEDMEEPRGKVRDAVRCHFPEDSVQRRASPPERDPPALGSG
jgi:hypothetical protein